MDSFREGASIVIDELNAETERLKAENKKLASELESLLAELKDVRGEARDRRHENKSLTQQLVDLTSERDSFRAKAETSAGEWQARIDELTGTVRGMKHDRAYETVARGLKVSDPARIADLITLASYSPEGDEPDFERIADCFQATLKARSWLLDPVDEPRSSETGTNAAGAATNAPGGAIVTPTATAAVTAAPGSDRGLTLSSSKESQVPKRPAGRF